ncbi:MFS transporter [Danxiaibacter flavus]|uniref:MFS transporter n=1 Tax=Danxiaibacter flavus TaxID=3049108 RepID=A0ABV3ZJ81_9BACT|nr:MFS transporter [Chitinophagaceae bacterium DXS]
MEVNQIFYAWVPKYIRYTILLLMVFVVLCANGVYLGITTDMYSDLGVYSEPYTMATNAMYIGMGLGFLFIIRLAVRFPGKPLLIFGFAMMLFMNIICATANNPFLTVAASFVLGFTKVLALGQIYLAWLVIWSKNMDASRVYPFFYFVALAGLNFITWLTTWFAHLFSWRYAYIIVLILILLCIVLAVIFLENHKLRKKIPLYQLDIPGLLLLAISLMLINYVAVYGKVEDWFSSNAIRLTFFMAAITILLFIKRELSVRRPILDFRLFKVLNVSAGLLLFFLLGALTPTTFQSALSINILHFELIRNAELSLFLIPGILAGSILTFFWYRKHFDSHLLFIIGFSAIVLYHIMMYTRFVNDLNIDEFWLPSFFRGFALAILYISIGLYATANLPIPVTLKVVGLILIVRSFLATGLASGLYNYFLYANSNRHLSMLTSEIDANELTGFQHTDFTGYYKYMLQQANLAASKEISGSIIIFGISIVIVLIIAMAYKKIKKGLLQYPAIPKAEMSNNTIAV